MRTAAASVAVDTDLVGKKALCEVLRWSRPTLDARLNTDANFPVRQRGTRGGGWAFSKTEVLAYLAGAAHAPPAAVSDEESGGADVLPFVAPAAGVRAEHKGEASARQLRDQAAAEWTLDKLRRNRGELVEAADMRDVLSTVLTKLRTSITSLPDAMVKEFGLSERTGYAMKARIEAALRAAVLELRAELGAEDPAADA